MQLKHYLNDEGGPLGCFFDFTDREQDVLNAAKAPSVIARWGWANSSHVIDTAFYLVGRPIEMQCHRAGSWDCHPTGNIFSGCGKTSQGLFSYFGSWASGGRWNIEVATSRGRYKLSPMEQLQVCIKNQFTWQNVPLNVPDHGRYKPGLYNMVAAALTVEGAQQLPDLKEQIDLCHRVDRIFGYVS